MVTISPNYANCITPESHKAIELVRKSYSEICFDALLQLHFLFRRFHNSKKCAACLGSGSALFGDGDLSEIKPRKAIFTHGRSLGSPPP